MSSENDIKRERELVKKRSVLKSKLTIFGKTLDSYTEHDQGDAEHLTARMDKLEKDLEAFELIQDELEAIASGNAFDDRCAERLEFQETHYDTMRRARNIVAKINIANDKKTVSSPSPIQQSEFGMNQVGSDIQIKLPTMSLPKFSGSYEAWPGFCDAFKSAVHDNPNFRDSQKLMYLRSCLTGKAADKIESLTITSANYQVAWDLLEKSYNDPSIIIINHVQAMFELPACTRSNATSLGELLDSANKHYRALRALNQSFLEAFPIYTVVSKI